MHLELANRLIPWRGVFIETLLKILRYSTSMLRISTGTLFQCAYCTDLPQQKTTVGLVCLFVTLVPPIHLSLCASCISISFRLGRWTGNGLYMNGFQKEIVHDILFFQKGIQRNDFLREELVSTACSTVPMTKEDLVYDSNRKGHFWIEYV